MDIFLVTFLLTLNRYLLSGCPCALLIVITYRPQKQCLVFLMSFIQIKLLIEDISLGIYLNPLFHNVEKWPNIL